MQRGFEKLSVARRKAGAEQQVTTSGRPMLNGWLRLWVLVSSLYLLGIVTLATATYPGDPPNLQQVALRSIELLLREEVAAAAASGDQRSELELLRLLDKGAQIVRAQAYGDLSDREIIEKVRPKLKQATSLASLAQQEEVAASERRTARWSHVVRYALIWLVPLVLLLCLGWGIGWVRKGFQQRDEA